MLEALFWISAFLVAYIYAGYPALAWLLARFIGRPVRKVPILPRITVLTAAHNEAAHIEVDRAQQAGAGLSDGTTGHHRNLRRVDR
jgi:hypothetical protein